MFDFYFVYSIIDIIWKIFSILFVLYRFTSFFNMMYEFVKFLGKLFTGLVYVKDQIVIYLRKRNNYSYMNESDLPIRPKSYFTILKENCKKIYNNFFEIIHNDTYLPLYETRTEYNEPNFEENTPLKSTNDFNNMLNSNMLNSDISFQSNVPSNTPSNVNSNVNSSYDQFDSYLDINNRISNGSIYPPPKLQLHKKVIEEEHKSFFKSEFIHNMMNGFNDERNEIVDERNEIVHERNEIVDDNFDETDVLFIGPNI